MAIKVTCPKCGTRVPPELFYSAIGHIRSDRKAAAAARNGRKGGAPKGNQNWKGRVKAG